MTEITQEQIEAKAREIGARPYHAVILPHGRFAEQKFTGGVFIIEPDKNQVFAYTGISIKQELMRTAMGTILSVSDGCILSVDKKINCIDFLNLQVHTILIQMAKDELGVK